MWAAGSSRSLSPRRVEGCPPPVSAHVTLWPHCFLMKIPARPDQGTLWPHFGLIAAVKTLSPHTVISELFGARSLTYLFWRHSSLTHVFTLTLAHAHSFTLAHMHTHSHFHPLMHTCTHTCRHMHLHTHTCTHTHTCARTCFSECGLAPCPPAGIRKLREGRPQGANRLL